MAVQRASASARDAGSGTVTQCAVRQGGADPRSAAEDEHLRAGLSCEVGIVIGEGLVCSEPVVPPIRVARRRLPKGIRIRGEVRDGEDAHV